MYNAANGILKKSPFANVPGTPRAVKYFRCCALPPPEPCSSLCRQSIFVTSYHKHTVYRFNARTGSPQGKFTHGGPTLFRPMDLEFDPFGRQGLGGNLYVARCVVIAAAAAAAAAVVNPCSFRVAAGRASTNTKGTLAHSLTNGNSMFFWRANAVVFDVFAIVYLNKLAVGFDQRCFDQRCSSLIQCLCNRSKDLRLNSVSGISFRRNDPTNKNMFVTGPYMGKVWVELKERNCTQAVGEPASHVTCQCRCLTVWCSRWQLLSRHDTGNG